MMRIDSKRVKERLDNLLRLKMGFSGRIQEPVISALEAICEEINEVFEAAEASDTAALQEYAGGWLAGNQLHGKFNVNEPEMRQIPKVDVLAYGMGWTHNHGGYVQSSAMQVGEKLHKECAKRLDCPSTKPVLQVHDELFYEVPTPSAVDAKLRCIEAMMSATNFDPKAVTLHWGDKEITGFADGVFVEADRETRELIENIKSEVEKDPTEKLIEEHGDFWCCFNQQCPPRAFIRAHQSPTCYTCGEKMETVK